MEFKKVTMNLTHRDLEIADALTKRLHSRNKASTVSAALSITEGITRRIEAGGELMIRKKDGSLEAVVIAGGRGGLRRSRAPWEAGMISALELN